MGKVFCLVWTRPWIALAILAGVLSCLSGCNGQWPPLPTAGDTNSVDDSPVGQPVVFTEHRAPDRLRIGTFNIQVFGQAKAQQPQVMDILVDVARRFDVLAIQEVRTQDPQVIEDFVRQINATGARYGYLLGPRLGRTSSKEQYLFVYDRSRVEVDRRACYTVADPQDLLHREPLVARFRAITDSQLPGFSFSLVNIHTDPDEVQAEINVLDDVLRAVRQDGSGEDDVILLGDLNASISEFGELAQLPYLDAVIQGQPTNTRQNASYDNIVFDRSTTTEFTGDAGIIDLRGDYRLTLEQALQVSDHLPVWAEFSTVENAPGSLATPGGVLRR